MPKDQYVILTGGKNNAGDFLIKYKAKKLFAEFRPDREIVDWDGWKPLTREQLDIVNDSRALLLVGGPALQGDMYPRVYPLTPNLDDIKVPVIMMGVGYKEENGHWMNTHFYPLSSSTRQLLRKIDASGYKSSVRDYHTLNVLMAEKMRHVIMTGCPALYETTHIGKPYEGPESPDKIAFSLGVSYHHDTGMRRQMLLLIGTIAQTFGKEKVTVYLHHRISREDPSHGSMMDAIEKIGVQQKMIAGTEKELVEVYGGCDFHVGYRVHAHVHASSMSRPSILINEDSRGKGFYTVMSGMVMDGYYSLPKFNRPGASLMYKAMGAVKKAFSVGKKRLPMEPYEFLHEDVIAHMKYEMENGFPRLAQSRAAIDSHFERMRTFLQQLP